MSRQKGDGWQQAKRICRLTDEEVQMAKELGLQPKSLIRNNPSPSQRWKLPVNLWVRNLYEDKIASKKPQPAKLPVAKTERRNQADPWPDNPDIPDRWPDAFDSDGRNLAIDEFPSFDLPDDDEIDGENSYMLQRQRLFRWAAQSIAIAASEIPEVTQVAAFGAVSQALEREVPRFREFRRHGIELLHECADLDLAVWLSDFGRLSQLKKAMVRALALLQDTRYGGVAHHQVDVHLFDSPADNYRGRLCIFNQCPKPGKRECRVPGCGVQPFVQQVEGYRFNPSRFAGEPKVILFDRSTNFLVGFPKIEAMPDEVNGTFPSGDDDFTSDYPPISDDDVPF